MSIGANLKLIRKKGLRRSQAEMAQLAEISLRSIANYEGGHQEPGADILRRLAKAYGVPVDVFFIEHAEDALKAAYSYWSKRQPHFTVPPGDWSSLEHDEEQATRTNEDELSDNGGDGPEPPECVELTRRTKDGDVIPFEQGVPPMGQWHPGLRDLWHDRSGLDMHSVTNEDIARVAAMDLRTQGYKPVDRARALAWVLFYRQLYREDLAAIRR